MLVPSPFGPVAVPQLPPWPVDLVPARHTCHGGYLRLLNNNQWREVRLHLELNVDAYSGAFVGASTRGEEDSRAVVEASKTPF